VVNETSTVTLASSQSLETMVDSSTCVAAAVAVTYGAAWGSPIETASDVVVWRTKIENEKNESQAVEQTWIAIAT